MARFGALVSLSMSVFVVDQRQTAIVFQLAKWSV